MKEKKTMIKMMIVFALNYFSFTIPYILMIPFLEKIGYSGTQQGLILAIGSLLGLFGQMIFGYLCDKYRTVKKLMYVVLVLLGLFTWTFYMYSDNQFILHLAVGSFMHGFFMIGCGVLDSWGLEADETCTRNYGSIRAFGAIGWIIGGPMVAWLSSEFGYSYFGIAFAIITVINVLISSFAPDAQKPEVTTKEEINAKDVKELLKNKKYTILLAIFFIAFFILQAEAFLSIQKIVALSQGNSDYYASLKSSAQALTELPFFFLGGYLIKKFGSTKLLLVAMVFYVVRIMGGVLANEAMHIVFVSGLQMLTFPFISITSKAMIDEEIPEKLRSTGQQFAVAVYNCGAAFMAPLLCGFMMDSLGVDMSLIALTVCPIIAIYLCLVYSRMKRKTACA